jgi:hypothetical protein
LAINWIRLLFLFFSSHTHKSATLNPASKGSIFPALAAWFLFILAKGLPEKKKIKTS